MGHSIQIEVECYAGYKGEEVPRAIRFVSQTVTVKNIVDQWIGPDHRYFKIIGDDDATYIIRHDSVKWRWELTFYQAAM